MENLLFEDRVMVFSLAQHTQTKANMYKLSTQLVWSKLPDLTVPWPSIIFIMYDHACFCAIVDVGNVSYQYVVVWISYITDNICIVMPSQSIYDKCMPIWPVLHAHGIDNMCKDDRVSSVVCATNVRCSQSWLQQLLPLARTNVSATLLWAIVSQHSKEQSFGAIYIAKQLEACFSYP